MKNIDEIINAKLVKRYYSLVRKLNYEGFETDWLKEHINQSPMDMNNDKLREYCLKFEKILNPENPETETLRNKVIEEIGKWLELYGTSSDPELNKVIAVGESGFRFFDEIPANKLRGIYRKFKKKRNDFLLIEKVIADISSKNNRPDLSSPDNP